MKNLINFIKSKKLINKKTCFIVISILIVLITSLILFFTYKQSHPENGSQLAKVNEETPEQISQQPSYTVTINANGGQIFLGPSKPAVTSYSKTFEEGTPTIIAYTKNLNDTYTEGNFYGANDNVCWLSRPGYSVGYMECDGSTNYISSQTFNSSLIRI